jgi:protocatechuate 3,4-dioxygenase beta subunit
MAQDHFDGGFHRDFGRLLTRRQGLLTLAGAVVAPGLARAACAVPASETAGPFPSDGSNRIGLFRSNVLAEAGVLRADLTQSFAGLTGTAEGVPTELELTLVAAGSCTPLAGAALYAWHCTADGRYSLYEVEDQNFLRGLGVADANGVVRFTTIFPGCYRGRWPHIHIEVFASAETATDGDAAVLTSQLALDGEVAAAVYSDARYGDSAANLAAQTLASDNVFADNSPGELAVMSPAVTGSTADGYSMTATIAVAV